MSNNPLADEQLAELDRWLNIANQPYHARRKAAKAHAHRRVTELVPALRQRLTDAESRLEDAERVRDASSAEVSAIKAAVDLLWAGTWDAHYGNGISAEYARSVEKQLRTALDAKISVAWLSARDARMKREGAAMKLLDMSLGGYSWHDTALRNEAEAMLLDAGEHSRFESMLEAAQRLLEGE